ncbi:hypothetical protein Ocin01_05413 [Orchesella cincta]|uniref:Uncharacterized protein n=1 Tax=Orchesella cincta TaxID=48709 RepID=A0A1D2N7K6_ORCCI|nr:hypothetical protein Ocin01_05413 [Orchesella cincta]
MEDWQREVIKTNLPQLVQYTLLNSTLMATMISRGILNDWDIWTLDAEKHVGKKHIEFYSIIQTRIGAYDALMTAMKATAQTACLSILKVGYERKTQNLI